MWQFNAGRPCCELPCCRCSFSASVEARVDLTGWSLVNDDCDDCVALAAEWLLPFAFRSEQPDYCRWRFAESGFCQSTCGAAESNCPSVFTMSIEVDTRRLSNDLCLLVARVFLGMSSSQPCPCPRLNVRYESQLDLNAGPTGCTGPFTLAKVSESLGACAGSVSSTIEVEFV